MNTSMITLIIQSDEKEIIAKVNKQILIEFCDYFNILLTKFGEKTSEQITIQVPNAYVMHDIIMKFFNKKSSMYNLPKWQYHLEYCRCCNFLCLPWKLNHKLLLSACNDIDFDLLFHVIGLSYMHIEQNMKFIIKLLSRCHTLPKFPTGFVETIKHTYRFKLISGGRNHTIRIRTLDPQDYSVTDIIEIHNADYSPVECVQLSNDLLKIASLGGNNIINIWNANNGKLMKQLVNDINVAHSLCFLPDSTHIVSADRNLFPANYFPCKINIWNIEMGKIIKEMVGHVGNILSLCCSPDGTKIAAGGFDGIIRIWDVQTCELKITMTGNHIHHDHHNDRTFKTIDKLCFSPDSKKIISTGSDGNIRIRKIDDVDDVKCIYHRKTYLSGLCYSPNYKYIIAGKNFDINFSRSMRKTNPIYVWNIESGRMITKLFGHTNWMMSTCFITNNIIASGSCDGTIRIWNLKEGKLLRTLTEHNGTVYCLAACEKYNREIFEYLKSRNVF